MFSYRTDEDSSRKLLVGHCTISTERNLLNITRGWTRQSGAARVTCPWYQLPQLRPGATPPARERVSFCRAAGRSIDTAHIRGYCHSGAYANCPWYRMPASGPNGAAATRGLGSPTEANRNHADSSDAVSTARRITSSALWIVGIPAVITLLILILAWLTENVWIATQAAQTFQSGFD